MKTIIYNIYIYLFARKKFERFNRFIATLGMKGIGVNNYHSRKESGEQYFLKYIFKNLEIRTVFDVGANVGDYTEEVLKINPSVRIFCFEPVGQTFKLLSKRFDSSINISVFNMGLSDRKSEAEIYDKSDVGTTHASLYSDVIAIKSSRVFKEKIKLSTLDAFVEEVGCEDIDLLKIDTEGNEYNVILGAQNALENNKIKVIHFEFNEMNIFSRIFFRDFFVLLNNYDIYRMLPTEFLPISYDKIVFNELFLFQNIVAFRKDVTPACLKS